MVVLVTCKNEEDPIKNEGAVVVTSELLVFVNCVFGYGDLKVILGIVHAHHSCGGKREKLSGSRLSTINTVFR